FVLSRAAGMGSRTGVLVPRDSGKVRSAGQRRGHPDRVDRPHSGSYVRGPLSTPRHAFTRGRQKALDNSPFGGYNRRLAQEIWGDGMKVKETRLGRSHGRVAMEQVRERV